MGAVFGMFAGFYDWVPKIIGLTYNEVLGRVHLWTLWTGVNLLILGLSGIQGEFQTTYMHTPSVIYCHELVQWCQLFLIFGYVIYAYGHPVTNNPWALPFFFTSMPVQYDSAETTAELEWCLESPLTTLITCYQYNPLFNKSLLT